MEPMITQQETCQNKPERHIARRIVGVVFGLVEIVLAFRLAFSLLGANQTNGFVRFIFNITQFFVSFFASIFSRVTTGVVETQGVFEPETLIAIVVVALVGGNVLMLLPPR